MSVEEAKSRGIPAQTVYNTKKEYQPKYKYKVCNPTVSTGSNVTINPFSQAQLTIEQWAEVFNNSRSYLEWDLYCPNIANQIIWCREDVFAEFQQVRYGNGGSFEMYDMQYVNKRMKVERKLRTNFADYQTNLPAQGLYPSNKLRYNFGVTVNGAVDTSIRFSGEFATAEAKVTAAGTAASTSMNNYNIHTPPIDANSLPTTLASGTVVPATMPQAKELFNLPNSSAYNGCVTNYLEPQYLYSVTTDALNRHRQMPLSAFGDIFALDKDIYFGQKMNIEIMTAPASQIVWTSTSAVDPTAGLSYPVDALGAQVNVQMKNVRLYLAIEENKTLDASVRAKFNSGNYKLQIPYTVPFKNSAAPSTALNFQIPMNAQYGKKIKKVMTLAFDTREANNAIYAFDTGNWNGQKIENFRSSWDGNYIQIDKINCKLTANGVINDDWRENQRHCVDTVIFNQGIYAFDSWFHIDDEGIKSKHYGDDSDLDVGKPFGVLQQNYMFDCILGPGPAGCTSITTYSFVTFLKDILITPAGVVRI